MEYFVFRICMVILSVVLVALPVLVVNGVSALIRKCTGHSRPDPHKHAA